MRLFRLPTEFLVFLLASSSWNAGRVSGAASSINVELLASFNSPPYILELLETAAEENATAYFPLLDRIAEGRFANCRTDQELYDTFLQLVKDDGHLTNPDALSSFQFALSIHSSAPRIEAHYHYYNTSVEPSLMVAQDAACPVWVHFDEKQYCSPALDRAQQNIGALKNPESLPFDRVLGQGSDLAQQHSVLYADITSPLFGQFHHIISSTARVGQTTYRVRYRPTVQTQQPLAVNGYGVELALKRTDYIVIDDRVAGAEDIEAGTALTKEGSSSEEVLLDDVEEVADLKPLSSKELLGLGLKTSSFIMASQRPFETLLKVSQDFPKHSLALTKRNSSLDFVTEHRINRDAFLPAGYNVIWMNGLPVQSRQMDAFALLEQMRRERSIVGNLQTLGFSGGQSVQILTDPTIANSKLEGEAQRYDYRDTLEGGKVIIWLNDIEKDKRYSSWSADTSALLQRTYPGQLPQIRRNVHNVILPVDLTDVKDLELVVESLQTFVKRKIPIRFGIVPMTNSGAATDQAKIAYHLLDTYGLSAVITYLESTGQGKKGAHAEKRYFDSTIKDRNPRRDMAVSKFQTVLESPELYYRVLNARTYLARLGADESPAPYFANGIAIPHNDAWLQVMSQKIDMDLRIIQRQVYEELLPEDASIAGGFLKNATTHRNALIVPEDEDSIKIIDISSLILEDNEIFGRMPRLEPRNRTNTSELAPSQMIVVADLDSAEGSDLLLSALTFCQGSEDVELIFVHNDAKSKVFPYSIVIPDLMSEGVRDFEDKTLEHILLLRRTLQPEQQDIFKNDKYSEEAISKAESFWRSFRPIILASGIDPGEQAIIFNGRVVGPIPKTTKFSNGDFKQVIDFEHSKRLNPAAAALKAAVPGKQLESALEVAVLCSTVALSTVSDIPEGIFESGPTLRANRYQDWEGNHTLIETGNAESSSIHLVASIDPTSQVAQRWIPILNVLSELSGVHLKLYLNPKERMQELPIKRFYRHILESRPMFSKDGDLLNIKATFNGLPKEALLNLAMDVPPAWLVAPKDSIHDLDNIKLSALKEGANVDATYELEHILIEGHSRDITVGPPPRGVQLYLGTEKDPQFADTIIMANLGYFQFKANPGFWNLQLQPGRSSDIFHIDSAGQAGYDPQPGDSSTDIALMSFQGKTLYPRLSRNTGQENEDVLEESKPGSPMDYLSKAKKLGTSILSTIGLAPSSPKHADINIFSVASGHLYERMLNIMMVSVMRHTSHTVKFWFIEQFLSPSFKVSLPYLAAHYNFDYELVTYKWPHWLRHQSEKQREIWGYKILFLDVLFPTSLDKVIFVDADQIVRTDMYDLVTLDLDGAPYGFTPMCDSRTSMEGFRFWKTGYWANFLRGLPYHISALYVVDLRLFRQIAAGDRLRQQYHQLSADPGSLSNLDQDLPNHMQHVLRIKSLPQEWLWCETWCSDESLATARTIDLCNNPETKEPKLSRARRQVPEWTVYDDEIAEVLRLARDGEGERIVAAGKPGSGDEAGVIREGESVQEVVQKEDEERVKRGRKDEL